MVILIYQYNVNICVYFALQHEKLLDFGEDRCLLNSIFCAIHFACELIGVVILLQELCRTLCERCRFPQECESCMQLVRISYPSNRANQRSKQVNFEEKTISWLFLMNLFLSYTVIAKLPGRYLYSVHISQISRNSKNTISVHLFQKFIKIFPSLDSRSWLRLNNTPPAPQKLKNTFFAVNEVKFIIGIITSKFKCRKIKCLRVAMLCAAEVAPDRRRAVMRRVNALINLSANKYIHSNKLAYFQLHKFFISQSIA